MNTEQQLFSIFYAVLYGAMLTSLAGLRAFPWGFPIESSGKRRLLWRLFTAVICFNIAPFFIFAGGYSFLSCPSGSAVTFWDVFVIAAASLSVYAPYRLYHILMVALSGTCMALYDEKEYCEIVSNRKIRKSKIGHMLAFVFYGGLLILLALQ